MHFKSVAFALGTLSSLMMGASASPVDIERRQAPTPVPPYVNQGVAIYKCTKPNTVALTFDDGPHDRTVKVLNLLRAAGQKATFFVNGANWGTTISSHVPTVNRMFDEGHQVGSHTWSHPYLTKLTASAAKEEMTKLEKEMLRLFGRYPTYMRPPYFDFNTQTLDLMKTLKYRVIIADIDTKDFEVSVDAAFNNFVTGLDNKGSIVLNHDVNVNTADTLLARMLKELNKRKLKSVPVGECLGEHPNNWYRWVDRT